MTPSSKTKLVRHRWAMHALQALSRRDPHELTRVFTELKDLPAKAMDTPVQSFGYGAPMQFHNFGFFGQTGPGSSSPPLFDHVVDGDTMLLIALRSHDPCCAIALIKLGSSLHVSNYAGESPLQVVFDAMAFLQLHTNENTTDQGFGGDNRLLNQRDEYAELFTVLKDELAAFYNKQKDEVERELADLYQRFAPDRVSKIPAQLEAYAYREHLLLESAKKKYMS
ncbi:hypothetical protein PRIC1_014595 [Phytophthora ramorum]|uniref:uncharacterized protein n=1 Tax=Phytophthora ramorum TaxID=164328 RepID=UPI0030AD8064|nr:hypothetical protein KRP23_11795 [Phytophthora ramorum]KAH7496232.1 hypothetical protein KRP22_14126 [Phytophthora ramorum]